MPMFGPPTAGGGEKGGGRSERVRKGKNLGEGDARQSKTSSDSLAISTKPCYFTAAAKASVLRENLESHEIIPVVYFLTECFQQSFR